MVLVFITEQPHHVQPYFHHGLYCMCYSMDQTVMAFITHYYVQMHFEEFSYFFPNDMMPNCNCLPGSKSMLLGRDRSKVVRLLHMLVQGLPKYVKIKRNSNGRVSTDMRKFFKWHPKTVNY